MNQYNLFQFPKSIPNDIEGFIEYYPWKFPGIIQEYEYAAKKYHFKPKEFRKFYFSHRKDLNIGLRRIKKFYNDNQNHSLEILTDVDQKINKLYCYRFWIINYLFCDGPLHSFYVDKIREYVRKIGIIPGTRADAEESCLKEMERNLLQGDYADLYLRNAMSGVKIIDILENIQVIKPDFEKLKQAVAEKNNKKTKELTDEILTKVQDKRIVEDSQKTELLIKALSPVLDQVRMRKNKLPLYTTIVHDIEFYEQNKELKKHHRAVKKEIREIFKKAKKNLSAREYSEFKNCYLMVSELSESKDALGEIDLELLPFWFQVLNEIQKQIPYYKKSGKNLVKGMGSIFYSLIWHLPPKIKAKVFTPDETLFNLYKF